MSSNSWRRHGDSFKKDHKDHCNHCHDKGCNGCKDKGKSLFTEIDVDQSTNVDFNHNNKHNHMHHGNMHHVKAPVHTLGQVKVCTDDGDDKVLVQATVEWTPRDLPGIPGNFDLVSEQEFAFPVAIEGTFTLFRSCGHGDFVPIFQTRDTSPICAIPGELERDGGEFEFEFEIEEDTPLRFSTITTSFNFVDKNPCCGENRYFLTLDLHFCHDPIVAIENSSTDIMQPFSTLFDPLKANIGSKVLIAIDIEDKDKKHGHS
ncbi:hypothetical protein JOC77_002467 [Peribacillus deserti]|uniref:DUF3794 domain-containing protein n=1 Tax=Peribacillus deserti TaxID=673318 RepID=A0ABS2QIR3_9BACI|nr:hypothetical protein [Peribacillus deserti]MBM7693028.1 hypothetical protein [Peribacillus deserti]